MMLFILYIFTLNFYLNYWSNGILGLNEKKKTFFHEINNSLVIKKPRLCKFNNQLFFHVVIRWKHVS